MRTKPSRLPLSCITNWKKLIYNVQYCQTVWKNCQQKTHNWEPKQQGSYSLSSFCILYILRFYPEVFFTLCFWIALCNALLHPYLQEDGWYPPANLVLPHPPSCGVWQVTNILFIRLLFFPRGTQSNGDQLRHQHLQDLSFGSAHHSPGLTATNTPPHIPRPISSPPSCSILVASCGHFRGTILLQGTSERQVYSRALAQFVWLTVCETKQYRWLYWQKLRVWVVCHRPGLYSHTSRSKRQVNSLHLYNWHVECYYGQRILH